MCYTSTSAVPTVSSAERLRKLAEIAVTQACKTCGTTLQGPCARKNANDNQAAVLACALTAEPLHASSQCMH